MLTTGILYNEAYGVTIIEEITDLLNCDSNKYMAAGDYNCANFIVYDFKTDTYKKLFEKDAHIRSFFTAYYYSPKEGNIRPSQISRQWIFYMVKDYDFNGNEKINSARPVNTLCFESEG